MVCWYGFRQEDLGKVAADGGVLSWAFRKERREETGREQERGSGERRWWSRAGGGYTNKHMEAARGCSSF